MFSQNKSDFHSSLEMAENLKGVRLPPTPPFNGDINVPFWLKSENQSQGNI